jgi:hypothetical protein
MSDNFTYKAPNTEKYLQALLKLLKSKGETLLYDILRNSKCVIDSSSSYSRSRWNAYYTTIYFHVPTNDFDNLDIDEESRSRLTEYCDKIMPRNVGFDVMQVEISPSIDSEFSNSISALEDDLEEFSHSFGETENFYIPDDVLTKGKEMMKVYLYLYVIENYIRLFIEQVCSRVYGPEYFSKLNLTKTIKDTINGRKRSEEKNRWVSIRGDSELFYLDFIELATLIQNNWDIFKGFFPDQSWISSKLSELYSIRNLVAHNSYVSEHERNILQVNFRSIVKQLNNS